MRIVVVFTLAILLSACNQAGEPTETPVLDTPAVAVTPPVDSSTVYIHHFADTVLKTKITDALLKLPFVQKTNKYIDSLTNHAQGISFLLDEPGANETEVSVQAGFNSPYRFETYYRFFVHPKSMVIMVYDPVTGKKLTLKEFQQSPL